MNQQEHKKGLPFFGIGKILPFLKKFRRNLILMVTCGLMGSLVDIILPLFKADTYLLSYLSKYSIASPEKSPVYIARLCPLKRKNCNVPFVCFKAYVRYSCKHTAFSRKLYKIFAVIKERKHPVKQRAVIHQRKCIPVHITLCDSS